MILADLAIGLALLDPIALNPVRSATTHELFRLERRIHYQLVGSAHYGPWADQYRYGLRIKQRKVWAELERREVEGEMN